MPSDLQSSGWDRRIPTFLAMVVAALVLLFTWFSFGKSRSDSLSLLVEQGKAFAEALAQASENTISSETYYEHFVVARYTSLVATLLDQNLSELTEQAGALYLLTHDLQGMYWFDAEGQLLTEIGNRRFGEPLPDTVGVAVLELLTDPESNSILLLQEGESPAELIHYYLELSSQGDRVIILVGDASDYREALRQTGIGYLIQNVADEPGVEYIVYQAGEGIVFASQRVRGLLAIDSDPFLRGAIDSDSISSRLFDFQGTEVLELVRPFSSSRFPFGVFRVGLSLDGYRSVVAESYKQMTILMVVLLGFLLSGLLYLRGRSKRQELGRRYSDIKSMTDRILGQLPVGVVVVDAAGVVRLTNRTFDEIFATASLEGKLWGEAMVEHRSLLDDFMGSELLSDESEREVSIGDARCRLLLARSKIPNDGEAAPSVVMVISDVSRLREFEEQARRRERLSEMGDLAAGVAHEIRNPLNTISIAAQRLAREFAPQSNQDQYDAFTGQIGTETKRLNKIITRFLALAHEDQKSSATVELDQLLVEIGDLLRVEGDRLGLTVSVEVEPGLKVTGEPDRLRDLFLNLFNNSKEALAGKPGSFTITARRSRSTVLITVADSGPGIPRDLHEKVFAPYYTTKEAGTGLGLPTVQRIVTDMGGEVTIDPSYDGGVRFLVSLPAADGPSS